MKTIFAIIILLITIFFIGALLNKRLFITVVAERELDPILQQGTKKEAVLNYLVKIGRPANDVTTHHSNEKCATAHVGGFRWNCEYPSYVSTGWHTGMFNITRAHVQAFFVFDEKNELPKHYTEVSYTFL